MTDRPGDLEAYEAAFDRHAAGRAAAIDWNRLERQRELSGLEGEVDLRQLCAREAGSAVSHALMRMLLCAVVGLLFLLTGAIAWLVGEAPLPGLVAGARVLAWSLATFFFELPRLARESAQFDAKEGGAAASEEASDGR